MSNQFLSEIKLMSFGFAPKGWAVCNGQLLQINQNQALFSLLGTTYGGDGVQTFALPNLQGRVPLHMGSGFTLGQRGGEETHTLIINEMPLHVHTTQANNGNASNGAAGHAPGSTKALAQAHASQVGGGTVPVNIYGSVTAATVLNPGTIGNTGGSQPHVNQQPYLTVNFCIALQGIFPSQN